VALILEIKVISQSGRSHLIIDKSGLLKCYVKAAPEKGKANKEVVEIVAKIIGVSKQAVGVVSGLTGRKKLLKIQTNHSYEDVMNLLGWGIQIKLF
tara:strand:+ start:456 stop:743 length:288 start_codon:yes stop_codon:yes gene_type:complete